MEPWTYKVLPGVIIGKARVVRFRPSHEDRKELLCEGPSVFANKIALLLNRYGLDFENN